MRKVIALLLLIASACGTKDGKAVATFAMSSNDFKNGGPLPLDDSCDGSHRRPILSWSQPPEGTRSYALIVDDPDAPGGTFHHWGAYDIPANLRAFGSAPNPGRSAINDANTPGYTAACPPRGDKPHHYHFKLYALDVPQLQVDDNVKVQQVEEAAKKHMIGRAEIVATYQRK